MNVAYSAGETELHDVMLVVYIIHVTVHRKVFIIHILYRSPIFFHSSSGFTVEVREVGFPFVPPGTFSSLKGLGCLLSLVIYI